MVSRWVSSAFVMMIVAPASADDQKVLTIHSLYVRFLLPMMCEVQWWEFAT